MSKHLKRVLGTLLIFSSISIFCQDNTSTIRKEILGSWHVDNNVIFDVDKSQNLIKAIVLMPVPENDSYQTVSNVEYSIGCQYYSECCPHVLDAFDSDFDGHVTRVSFNVELHKLVTDFSKITTIFPYDTTTEEYRENTRNSPPFIDIDYKIRTISVH